MDYCALRTLKSNFIINGTSVHDDGWSPSVMKALATESRRHRGKAFFSSPRLRGNFLSRQKGHTAKRTFINFSTTNSRPFFSLVIALLLIVLLCFLSSYSALFPRIFWIIAGIYGFIVGIVPCILYSYSEFAFRGSGVFSKGLLAFKGLTVSGRSFALKMLLSLGCIVSRYSLFVFF